MLPNIYPSNDYQAKLYRKYFHDVKSNSLYCQPFTFNEDELKNLLQSYGLESYSLVFIKLARLVTSFIESCLQGGRIIKGLDELYNSEVDLVNLAKRLKAEKVKWIELRPNVGDKVKLMQPFFIVQLGEAILASFDRTKEKNELTELVKVKKKKGKPITTQPIGFLISSILDFLNNETSLKSGKARISIRQKKFIASFLIFAKVINPEVLQVLEEDYISTTLNNYLRTNPSKSGNFLIS